MTPSNIRRHLMLAPAAALAALAALAAPTAFAQPKTTRLIGGASARCAGGEQRNGQ